MSETSTASVIKRISPMLAVVNMDQTLAFYQDILGFAPTMKSAEYSIVERDGQIIHFMKAASEDISKRLRGHVEIYVEVRGIRSIWDSVKNVKLRYKIRDLFDREYGMTEFHIEDPNGYLIFVGEPTAEAGKTAAEAV
jgi:catechol 2,3-dioxygenase-like lactoylglutathione lyase family enzyme